jgi:hypothetical protein
MSILLKPFVMLLLTRLLPFVCCLSFLHDAKPGASSPLAPFSKEWNDPKYLKCNTATKVSYMDTKEKEVIYILNLLRANPKLFANTVVQKYPDRSGQKYLRKTREYKSLLSTLQKMEPLPLLYPDAAGYSSAQCHANSSGKRGYVGHERNQSCKSKKLFDGECCDYGHNEALDIVLALLIDERVPSLTHRKICLGLYNKIGVSIQPHKKYRYNAVLDFLF